MMNITPILYSNHLRLRFYFSLTQFELTIPVEKNISKHKETQIGTNHQQRQAAFLSVQGDIDILVNCLWKAKG
jgi:hypothetical protein